MNSDIFKGKWNEVKGKVKQKWGKLTDNDLSQINGQRDQLLGKLQMNYGWDKQKAENELKQFEEACCKECKTCNDSEEKRKVG